MKKTSKENNIAWEDKPKKESERKLRLPHKKEENSGKRRDLMVEEKGGVSKKETVDTCGLEKRHFKHLVTKSTTAFPEPGH